MSWKSCNICVSLTCQQTNMLTIIRKLTYKFRDMWQTVAFELEGRCGQRVTSIDITKFIERQVKILTNPMFGDIQDVPSLTTYRGVNKPNLIPRSGIKDPIICYFST